MAAGASGGRRLLRWATAGLLTAVLLAGLVTLGTTPVGELFGGSDALPGTAPALLTDRGAVATVAALRETDACRLADADGSDAGRSGPHECTGARRGAVVTVKVGDTFPRRSRWASAPIVVGGVKAYRSRMIGDRSHCSVAIPVTFDYAIGIDTFRTDEGDACRSAEEAAAAAVPVLRAQPRRPDPATAPLTDVDPCAVLAAAGPYDPASLRLGTDSAALEPGIDRCTAPAGRRHIEVTLDYGEPTDGSSSCTRERPVSRGRTGGDQALVRVAGDREDCAAVEALAARLPAAFDAARPPERATRPVRLFTPDEPDDAVTGPCADLEFECLEPADVTLPATVDALLSASGTDTSVTCRMAEDSVHRAFGPSLRPTIYGDFCHFVDERHEIDVGVAAGSSFDLRDHGNGDPSRRDLVVAGHEVRYSEPALLGDRTYDWVVRPRPGPPDPVADATGRGVLTVVVSHRPPRGEELGPDDMPFDPAVHARSEQVVTDLLDAHFR